MKKILRAISQTASPQSLIEFLVLWHSTRILQFWVKSSIYGVPKPIKLYPNIGNGPTNRLQKVLELIFKWSTSTFHFHFLSFWFRRYINDIYNFFSSHYRKTQLLLYQIDIFVHFLCNPSNHVSVTIFDLICVFGSVTILLMK